MSVSFSVLDLAPVVDGSTVSQALNQSIALAVAVEEMGYRRFWLAEHHNMPGIASSSPAVMIGQVARATSTIRVGSGGVMLPNHAPLVVAEQFGTLDALFPDRIDLGIGRAPGTDQVTAHALRRAAAALSADDFPQELAQLRAFLSGQFPPEHPYSAITAVPGEGAELQMWMLGSSTYSAQVAGLLGLPFAFARHFAPAATYDALAVYRDSFRPGVLDEPYAMVTVTVVAAGDDATAREQAAPHRLAMARLREGGRPGRYPTVAQALAEPLTARQEATIGDSASAWIVGGRDRVAAELRSLIDSTGANEIMVSSMLADFDARLESHRIVADILAPAHA
ncbi:LLM class flavin-dependent oxidoreductase [Williamsia deligens]|uniref:LLM class flavin-dependent oxidoreductase n=1 Tax=Williamsia deligens TaxID=321325 RepID=A0ABW3GDP8_9NOCA|nr:LLM class flavin-dependent oxidoreductase [Williamsia deligens]MCP2195894.1 luciferase family oxidoreductase, group 1 [Williamsia deligens]